MIKKSYLKYLPRIVAAFILLQTLFFKFGIGGELYLKESKELFSNLLESVMGSGEHEAYARITVGILELIAGIALLIPRTGWMGALLGIGLMVGAILSHLLFIGISINDDGGQLMVMAVIVLLCCLRVINDEKEGLKSFLKKST